MTGVQTCALPILVNFYFNNGKAGVICNITIYDSNGNSVYRYRLNRMMATDDAVSWDGFLETGSPAPPGVYVALIELFDLKGMVQYEKKPFVLAKKTR